jgi:hypothetical protein
MQALNSGIPYTTKDHDTQNAVITATLPTSQMSRKRTKYNSRTPLTAAGRLVPGANPGFPMGYTRYELTFSLFSPTLGKD